MTSKNKVIVITGASTGIGEALAAEFLTRGATVVMTSRELARVEEARGRVLAKVRGADTGCVAMALDVRSPQQVRAVIAVVQQRFGRIDCWVNNAGFGLVDSIAEMSAEQVRSVFETNFFAAVDCMQAVLPLMTQQRSGTVINVSSVVGHISVPFMSAYSATKHALNAICQSARVELRGTGVHVITVCPGRVKTQFADNVVRGSAGQRFANGLRRGIEAERVARAIVRGYERGSREVVVPWTDKLFIKLNQLAPSLVEFGMRKMIEK